MWHISGTPASFGHLQRDVERHGARVARGAAADTHLDADDHVAVGVGDLHRADRVHQAQLLALADHDAVGEGVDAGVRDVQVGEDAHLRTARSRACGSRRSCPGPALPVSTAVVTPEVRQNSSASMPSEVPPQ